MLGRGPTRSFAVAIPLESAVYQLLAEDAAVLDRRPTRGVILDNTLMSPKGRR